MRLTLRTLLAYLDDLLDRRDAEELETKIQSSPLASELVHRIRNTVGQIRLDSPPVDGEGMGGDPNTVAEYLDNTLPPERVPDFERVCLDSDVNLGEVASCHQVLTLVLGEPAEVKPEMRRRVYDLVHGEDASTDVLDEPVNASMGSTRLPVTSTEYSHHGEQESVDAPEPASVADDRWKYPDEKASYTKERSFGVVPLLLTALAAFVLVIAGLRGLGPLDGTHPIAKLINGEQVASNDSTDATTADVPVVELGDESFSDTGSAIANDSGNEFSGADLVTDEFGSDVALPDPTVSESTMPEIPAAEGDDGEVVGDQAFGNNEALSDNEIEGNQLENGEFGDEIGTAGEPGFESNLSNLEDANLDGPIASDSDAEASELTLTNPGNPVAPPEPRPLANPIEDRIRSANRGDSSPVPTFSGVPNGNSIQPEAGFDDAPIGDSVAESAGTAIESADGLSPPFDPVMEGGPGEPNEMDQPNSLAQLVTKNSVLLRVKPNSQSWERASVDVPLVAGELYLSLPVFRSQIVFGNGMNVTLVGGTRIALLPSKRNGVPRIQINFGKIVAMPSSDQGLDLDVLIGNRETEIIFDDASSALALEVRREHLPGTDPTGTEPMTVVAAYATTGIVHWTELAKEEILISAGQRLAFVDDRTGTPIESTVPNWLVPTLANKPILIDAALERLAPKISFDRPVVLSLQEQTESKLLDVRSLTACSLAYLGHMQPIVNALNDTELKAFRTEQFETLKTVVAIDPKLATKVRDAFALRHGDRTGEFFRMLWGYSPSELQSGGATTLVEHLQDDSLDFRVIAIETLKNIVGKTKTMFGPEHVESSRRRAYLQWLADAKNGKIAYKDVPTILELTK